MEERGRGRRRRGGGRPGSSSRSDTASAGEDSVRRQKESREYTLFGEENCRSRGRGRGKRGENHSHQRRGGGQEGGDGHNKGHNQSKNRHNDGREKAPRSIGFFTLEDIANAEVNDIIYKINERKNPFMNLIETTIDSDKLDIYVLILRIISKVSLSAFDQLKLNLVMDICNSKFIGNLRNYMMDLPYAERKIRNKLYWNNEQQFWEDFIVFCEYIIEVSPTTAFQKCRSLIENTSKTCLEGLQERHSFYLSEELLTKLTQLRERLANIEKEKTPATKAAENKLSSEVVVAEESEPPDDFRNLSVVPTNEDLLVRKPFVRPNIIAGGYRDIEHYLDVQFRLLREDCFGPIREGIIQFMEDPKRRKFDNIRVFGNVTFVGPYVSDTKIGTVVQFDEKTRNRFKKINWAHNKRFIFGSLLLFTKDNCRSFVTATILERDEKMLAKGMIPVSIVDARIGEVHSKDVYVMIESEVYFEPYFHILKALKEPKFPQELALSKYIVHVDAEPKSPAYLSPTTEYQIVKDGVELQFKVMQEHTWPSKEMLGLNESQYEAYKLALTHEFAVIQGPPGTGKTFLGVQIAEILLKNDKLPMLVICYTNHALDQFLEAIMSVTNDVECKMNGIEVVRIGGQSRNEAMNAINLSKLRRGNNRINFFEEKCRFRRVLRELKHIHQCINALNEGILSYNCLKKFSRDSIALGDYYATQRPDIKSDPLRHWLFENMEYDANIQVSTEEVDSSSHNDGNRNDVLLDNFEDDETETSHDFMLSFSFSKMDVLKQIKELETLKQKIMPKFQERIENELVNLKSRLIWFNRWSEIGHKDDWQDTKVFYSKNDMSKISTYNRWLLYFKWAKRVSEFLLRRARPLENEFEPVSQAYEEARFAVDLQLLRKMSVIGMTTSGAARLRKLLKGIAARIVIVEEAAEVLEQHIITSLTKDCEHLILIGDHQQLRPSAAHVKLARHYNIEVSLFERMITNGIHSRTLTVQHRMRPQIAALISPHIYPALDNHPSVKTFPSVRGMAKNVFFFSHDYKEEEMEDSNTKSNSGEADVALGLCNYLIQQRYEPKDITVLAAYSGQMFYMRKQSKNYANLAKVKITVVDNYQGEESKIIILSLVRNNTEGRIGFLGTENRICVALSRAREGMYILGNMNILKENSNLWKNIASTLESEEALGSAFILRCENHPEQITSVCSAKDFDKVPEGGCLLKCKYNLKCGHPCPLVCHAYDTGHIEIQCYMKCERILCELGHECKLICYEDCRPCKQLVEKLLPCGHNMKIFCHLEPTDDSVKCPIMVNVTLPNCGHEATKKCHEALKEVRCIVPCEYRVEPCGHMCERSCHVTNDPNHEKYCCNKPCAKAKQGCTQELTGVRGDHQCLKKCYEQCDPCNVEVFKKRSNCRHVEKIACCEDVNKKPCFKKCTKLLECGHHCKKKCSEECGDCKQQVTKTIPDCNHKIKIECRLMATRKMCDKKCERTLPCGHVCAARCGDDCSSDYCTQPIDKEILSPCGHLVILPCNEYRKHHKESGGLEPGILLNYCTEPCKTVLECEHPCSGTCSACHQGRVHVACTQVCQRPNICGHQCEEPCNKVCPPCKKPCEVRCEHSRCQKLCGQPCTPCNEECSRACKHGACTRRCGEECSRDACGERCPRALPCGHPCRGLCGEPCPDICSVCRPDSFPTGFINEQFNDDDKFIKLEDCNHVLDIDDMDCLMMADSETVEIKKCPFCRKPIINTQRYKNYVNNVIKTQINPVKQKVYGDKEVIKTRENELLEGIQELVNASKDILWDNEYLKKAFVRLGKETIQLESVSLLYLDMLLQYLNILSMICERYQKYLDIKTTRLQNEVNNVIRLLCLSLVANSKKLSVQLQKDLGNELKRLNSIIQFATILSHSLYASSAAAKDKAEEVEKIVLVRGVFDENAASEALKKLEEAVKLSGIVTKEERDLVVKAIGSKAGSWYKCPNGHFYCISDCGGAMVTSKCVDCGATIGGSQHRLLDSNAHAGEIDGSARPAWPIYDDMRNFGF